MTIIEDSHGKLERKFERGLLPMVDVIASTLIIISKLLACPLAALSLFLILFVFFSIS